MSHLSISLLGPFQATLDGQPITGFKSIKVRALLAYLAVEADRPHPREVLAGLLWPDWPDRDALSNLRYALSNLRQVIGDRTADPPFLLVTREALQFNSASDYSLDVRVFTELTESALSAAKGPVDLSGAEEATALYRGGFLEGFSLPDADPFEEWALLTRERLARQISSTLHLLSATCEERGRYQRAQSFARKQLELDPWDETAHRQLMRALALAGKRSAALAQYETCRLLLAEELDVEPARETTRLHRQISDETLAGPVPSAPPAEAVASPPAFLDGRAVEVERPVFVARERELAQLARYLEGILAAEGRVVFVTGEAGSGKTALVQEFLRRAQELHADLLAASGNCNARTGVGDPYLPFREILGLLTGDVESRWAAGAMTGDQARRLWNMLPVAAQALVETGPDLIDTLVPGTALAERANAHATSGDYWLSRLDELSERKASGHIAPAPQQTDLFEQYTRVLNTLARRSPLVLVMDDLQWADLGSVSLLFHLGRQLASHRILIVGVYRPEEVAIGRNGERHPLEPVVNELQRLFGDIVVDVDQAESRGFVEAFLDSEPHRLGQPFRERLYRQTRGHPLFTVELLRGMQERGDLIQDPEGRWVEGPALDWETLPARVDAATSERIGRLPQPLQAALRVASVEGEDFTAEVVARVLGTGDRDLVHSLSAELDRRHRLVRALALQRVGSRRLSRYRFRHDLFQRYLYDNLDEVERGYLHEDVGNALELLHGDQAREIAVQLARHFEEAGIAEKALCYLHQAGEKALQLSAYDEGLAHLTRGLALLMTTPDSPERAEQELPLQLALGVANMGTEGPQSVGARQAYNRARELSQQMGKTSQLCRVLGDLAVVHYVQAEYLSARDLAQQALSLAQQSEEPLLAALDHFYLGGVSFALGEYTTARTHFQEMISFYDPEQHHHPFLVLRGSDLGLTALAQDACCLWCLGYPDEAVKQSQEALTIARELDHPFTLADVLYFAGGLFNVMRRDPSALRTCAEELLRLSNERLPSWLPSALHQSGEAMVLLDEVEEAITQMQEAMAAAESTDIRLIMVGVLRALGYAQGRAARPREGLTTLSQAFALLEQTNERRWEAELYRVKGDLLHMLGDDAEAEVGYRTAIEVARGQQAKSWELRATTSLCRLLQEQGKQEEARRLLTKIYGWFTEGFDTPDLTDANALLQELS
jgi:DNA-binding SARP family transcriptional activator/predicted ATPase